MKTRFPLWMGGFGAVLGAALVTIAGCGSDDTVNVYDPTPPTLGGDASPDGAQAEACGSALSIGETAPLDIVFLLDRSGSMEGVKWDSVTHAVLSFANQGFPSPTQVALSFMPFPVAENVFGDQIATNYHTCDYRLYRDFEVPLGAQDSAAQEAALEKGFADAVLPVGFGFGGNSPMYAAMLGTYFTTAKLQAANPDHQVIVVIVGDGDANPCPQYPDSQTTSTALADLAKSALNQNGVRTFAVGTNGTGYTLLQAVAAAGGGAAFMASAQTSDDLLFQMQRIKSASIGCSFVLPAAPPGRDLDPATVSVKLTSSAGDARDLALAAGYGECATDSNFFLDDGAKPTKVTLCPTACAALKADPKTRAVVSFECKGVVR